MLASGSLLAFVLALVLASEGRLGNIGAAFTMPATFLALVASVFRLGVLLGPWANDETGKTRPLFERQGFWVIALGTLLYLPALGSFSLTDPWETHYGEVARGMLARDDWISTWTPQSGWFWSKPVLDMWLQALAMGALGAGYRPGEMLGPGNGSSTFRPEWCVRLPTFLLSIVALYAFYKVVARTFGRTAGLVAALVLATSSQWFLIAHQSITDMPLVAMMSISMTLLLAALHTDPDQRAKSYEILLGSRRLRVGLDQLVLGALLMSVLPQILYLLSRNIELQWVAMPHGFRLHPDVFWSGSKGNCGLPGNAACSRELPVYASVQPATQALGWAILLGAILVCKRSERRTRRLFCLAAWYFAAAATLAKGPIGFALPAAVAGGYLAVHGEWRQLLFLELVSGLTILAVVALPWYVAMFVRHGHAFTDELIFNHMYKRALEHVHDLNAGDDVSFRYYVWQLGYALFPWTGLVPAALLGWEGQNESKPQRAVLSFFGLWFVFAFALFTAMPTKFHHYVFPAVPPAAIMTGIWLERARVDRSTESSTSPPSPGSQSHHELMLGAVAVAGAILVALVGRDLVVSDGDLRAEARLIDLFTYNYHRPWPDSLDFRFPLAAVTIAVGVLTLMLVARPLRRHVVAMLLVAGFGYATWGLDVYLICCAPHWGQREIFERYVRTRAGVNEPIIAYRMNWLGEYFYSSNRIPAFGVDVSRGASLGKYVRDEVLRGTKTFFFVTEQASVTMLKNELGTPQSFDRLTDARLNNKFVLVRATFE